MAFRMGIGTGQAPTAGTPPVVADITQSAETVRSPVGGLVLISGAVASTSTQNNSRIGIGQVDGSSQVAMGNVVETGGLPLNQDCHTRHDDATCINLPVISSGALDCEARFASFQPGILRTEFDDVAAGTLQLLALLFYGCPIARRGFTAAASIGGTADVNDLDFEPDMCISVSHFNAYSADASAAGQRRSIGIAVKTPDGQVQQVCISKFCALTTPNTSYAGAVRDDAVLDVFNATVDSALVSASLWLPNGLRFTTSRVGVGPSTSLLFLKTGRRLWAGIPSLVTSSTGVKSITDPGFPVESYLCFASALATKNATDRTAASDGWSIGAHSVYGDGSTGRVFGGFEQDNVGTCATRSISDAKVAKVLLDTTPTFDWSAIHSAYTATGMDIDVDDASAADRLAAFVVIGAPKEPNWLPTVVKRRHRTMEWGPLGK